MRHNSSKYVVITIMAWLLVLAFGWLFIREPFRKQASFEEIREKQIAKGAELYAKNCVVCHGPLGEGVVGPALNRPDLQGDPEKLRDVYDMIFSTLAKGRPGTTVPLWEPAVNAQGERRWISRTAMPAWSRDNGGPLDDQRLEALTVFIMEGDWSAVAASIPAVEIDPATGQPRGTMPDAVGLTAEDNQAAQALFAAKGCIGCHTIGSAGGRVGPDLTYLGRWGVPQEFVKAWILDPAAMSQRGDRAPVWFSNYQGNVGTMVDGAEFRPDPEKVGSAGDIPKYIPYGPTQMPNLGLTEEEAELLSRYLIGLGVPQPATGP